MPSKSVRNTPQTRHFEDTIEMTRNVIDIKHVDDPVEIGSHRLFYEDMMSQAGAPK